jgi:polyphosphate kinase
MPLEVFRQVAARAQGIVERQYRCSTRRSCRRSRRRHPLPQALRVVAGPAEWIRDYFFREMMPVLTPIGLDPAHPFPRVFNKSLNFAVELEGRDAFGATRAPPSCRRRACCRA